MVAPDGVDRRLHLSVSGALAITALGTVGLGVWQAPWLQSMAQAVATLAMRRGRAGGSGFCA